MRIRQEQAVLALLTARTIADVAAIVGVNEKTIRRWLQQPDFKQALLAARGQVFAAVTGRLTKYALEACDVLHHVMVGEKTVPADSVRVRAARALLSAAIGIRLGEVFGQIEDLEDNYRKMQSEQQAFRDL